MRHVLAVLMACALGAASAQATPQKAKPEAAAAKAKTPAGKAPKFIKGSEETTSERDRRLKRGCKGRVNAGACAGYTG